MKVPDITVLCFQYLPKFPVQVFIFLEALPSQDLNLRAGLEDNVSKGCQTGPDRCWVLSHKAKGHWFDSW